MSAVGDFFLASRDIVRAVRGYAECGVNVHVDGLMVAAAAAHGFGSLVLGDGCELLHQQHDCLNACLTEVTRRVKMCMIDKGEWPLNFTQPGY